MVGCVVAIHLARGGADVVVLDARAPGRGATGRSAGFLIRGTADHPDQVASTIGRERALALWDYTAGSIDELVGLLREHRIECGLRRDGSLVLAMDDAERGSLRVSRELLEGTREPGEIWTGDEVEQRTGLVLFAGGWFRPGDGVLDPGRLCRGLADVASRLGARVISGVRVDAIDEDGNGVRLTTRHGMIASAQAVLATNAALPMIDARFGRWLSPVRAQMLVTGPSRDAARLSWPVYAHHGYEYWRQEPTGELLFGGCRWAAKPGLECGVTDDACVSETVFEAQRTFIARHLPSLASLPVRARWSGIMAFTTDGLPLVGRVPGQERLWMCAACNGHGLAFGPRSARLLAEAILHATPLPVDFTPARLSSRMTSADSPGGN